MNKFNFFYQNLLRGEQVHNAQLNILMNNDNNALLVAFAPRYAATSFSSNKVRRGEVAQASQVGIWAGAA